VKTAILDDWLHATLMMKENYFGYFVAALFQRINFTEMKKDSISTVSCAVYTQRAASFNDNPNDYTNENDDAQQKKPNATSEKTEQAQVSAVVKLADVEHILIEK
jgi:hypothetical protein